MLRSHPPLSCIHTMRLARAKRGAPSLIIALVMALSLAGCTREVIAPGLSAEENSRLLEPNTFMGDWSKKIHPQYGTPDRIFLRDDLVVVYTDQNVVYVLSASGGSTVWISRDVVGPLDRLWPPVLIDALNRLGAGVQRILVFPSNTSYIVYADTGERIRETPIDRGERALTSPSFGYEGLVYAGLSDNYGGRAAVVDPTREINPVILPRLLRGVVIGRPVVFEDEFFIADETGAVYGITQAGGPAWDIPRFQTGGPVTANLSADADGLYVASNDSVFYVLDRASGRLKWQYFAEMQLFRSAFPTQDHVFLPVEGQGVAALSKREGATINREPIWFVQGARDVLSHDEQNVYLLHADGRVAAHSKATGEELFSTGRSDFICFTRNASGPRIYAATADGEVVAIEPVLTRGRIGRLVMSDPRQAPDALPVK